MESISAQTLSGPSSNGMEWRSKYLQKLKLSGFPPALARLYRREFVRSYIRCKSLAELCKIDIVLNVPCLTKSASNSRQFMPLFSEVFVESQSAFQPWNLSRHPKRKTMRQEPRSGASCSDWLCSSLRKIGYAAGYAARYATARLGGSRVTCHNPVVSCPQRTKLPIASLRM